MKKILVPVDFSERSGYALKAAAKIAKKQNADIIVLHMLGLSESLVSSNANEHHEILHYIRIVEQRFQEFLNKDYLKGIKITDMVHNYQNFTEINNVAREQGANLIVMGSHGTSGFNEMFVGSNTERVVRTSEIPVLVIKDDSDDFNLESVLFVSEFRDTSVDVYKRAMAFFNLFNTKVELIYINLPADKFRSNNQLRARFQDFLEKAEDGDLSKLSEIVIYNDYSVESGVFNYCEKTNANLIAIPTHGRRGLAHFFSGSIGEDIVNRSSLPVLTLKI